MTRGCARTYVTLGLVALAGAAAAQPRPLPLASLQETFDQGVEAERTSAATPRPARFEEVLRHHDEPLVRVNLAISYRAVGRYVDAIAQLQRYLAAPLASERPEGLAQMRRALDEMRAQLGRVTLRVTPAAAQVRVDRRLVDASSPLALDPGDHALEVTAEGFVSARRELRVEAAGAQHLDLDLAPVPTTGRVVVTPSPLTAAVRVDGRLRGTGPADLELGEGEHVVEVSAPAHGAFRRTVRVTAGGVTHVDAALTATATTPRWLVPLVVIGSVALAGAAIAAAITLAQPSPSTDPLPADWTPTWGRSGP
ncbi:MAG: PEGA domain-containing protein [Polyangiales bacterium]